MVEVEEVVQARALLAPGPGRRETSAEAGRGARQAPGSRRRARGRATMRLERRSVPTYLRVRMRAGRQRLMRVVPAVAHHRIIIDRRFAANDGTSAPAAARVAARVLEHRGACAQSRLAAAIAGIRAVGALDGHLVVPERLRDAVPRALDRGRTAINLHAHARVGAWRRGRSAWMTLQLLHRRVPRTGTAIRLDGCGSAVQLRVRLRLRLWVEARGRSDGRHVRVLGGKGRGLLHHVRRRVARDQRIAHVPVVLRLRRASERSVSVAMGMEYSK